MMNAKRLLYFLAIIKFVLPFLLQHPVYEPHRDELLYLAEGKHMAWGYMEVPPLLSVFAWISNGFGESMFWIKCWPSLIGALTLLVCGRIILSLGGGYFALILAFLSFVVTGYLRVHFLFQPNFLEIFFWTMIAYALVRYAQEKDNRWLYVFGVSAGLGMMSKYSVAIMILASLGGLLLTKQRSIFRNKHLYYSAGLALVIFLPNLIWQAVHHFPVLQHMKELNDTQLQYISPSSFLGDQIIMLFPCAFIWLVGLWMVGVSKKEQEYRFIGWAYVLVIGILLVAHGKSYYALGIYPVLLAFGARQLERFTESRLKPLRYLLPLIPLGLAYYVIPVALPVLPPDRLAAFYERTKIKRLGVLKWEDLKDHPLPQDFSDMLGWKEMAEKMNKAYALLDSNEKKQTVLFCDNYGEAGAVNYYGKKLGLPPAYSANASFLYWMPFPMEITNLVLLTDDEEEMQHGFVKQFDSALLVDSVSNPYARERGNLIILLKGAHPEFNRMFTEKILQLKSEWKDH